MGRSGFPAFCLHPAHPEQATCALPLASVQSGRTRRDLLRRKASRLMRTKKRARHLTMLSRLFFCAVAAALLFQAAPAFLSANAPPAPAASTLSPARPLAAPPTESAPTLSTASMPVTTPASRGTLPDIQVHTELPIVEWLRPGEFAWKDDGV